MKYNSYYLYQKYCNIGGQGMIPVYPNVYSNDADGTQSKRLHVSGDTCCSDLPAIYRWVNLDPTIEGNYFCSGTTKCYEQQKQVSYDNGETWENVIPAEYQPGEPYEYQSADCGYLKQYLTFVALENGTFNFSGTTSGTSANTLSYSLDNGATWTSLANNTNTPTVTAGNTIMWKGNATPFGYISGIGTFGSSNKFDVEGNIMSILYGDDFVGKTSLSGKKNAFFELFYENTNVVNTQDLILPATTLEGNCYEAMFVRCTSLTTAPVLPATTLAPYCYANMFLGCKSLTTAPSLPATTLATSCCSSMFHGCTSLTTVASNMLSATTLATDCYRQMFLDCKSLTTAPELPATTLANSCYMNMFHNCKSLTTAPELPATTLADYCYLEMFYGCTTLSYIKCLATTLANYSTSGWVDGVSSTGTFVKASSMSSWSTGASGIPSGWTVQNAT